MNNPIKSLIQKTIFIIIAAVVSTSTATAAMISTQQVQAEISSSVLRHQVSAALQRDDVQRVLISKGVNPSDALARVAAMNNDEIALLHENIESLPAGAGAGGVLVTVVLVFVILDILGITNVFTFIRPAR